MTLRLIALKSFSFSSESLHVDLTNKWNYIQDRVGYLILYKLMISYRRIVEFGCLVFTC